MFNNTLTEYVAKQTMVLKDVNFCTSFVRTVWRDKPILVVYDNLNSRIVDVWFNATLQHDDLGILTRLVTGFLK